MSDGEPGRNRTFNLWIKSPLLCQLSYRPKGRLLEFYMGAKNLSMRPGTCQIAESGAISHARWPQDGARLHGHAPNLPGQMK